MQNINTTNTLIFNDVLIAGIFVNIGSSTWVNTKRKLIIAITLKYMASFFLLMPTNINGNNITTNNPAYIVVSLILIVFTNPFLKYGYIPDLKYFSPMVKVPRPALEST